MIHSSGYVGGGRTSGRYEHGATSVTCSGVYQGKRRKDRIHRWLQPDGGSQWRSYPLRSFRRYGENPYCMLPLVLTPTAREQVPTVHPPPSPARRPPSPEHNDDLKTTSTRLSSPTKPTTPHQQCPPTSSGCCSESGTRSSTSPETDPFCRGRR